MGQKVCIEYRIISATGIVLQQSDGWKSAGYENCALLGYSAASSGNFSTTFREILSVPSSGIKI